MSRKNHNIQGTMIPEPCKIRKRGCSSPASSTSSIFQNYRFKRAIQVGKKRGGSTTPRPAWNLLRSPAISVAAMRNGDSPASRCHPPAMKQPVSARKLGATLWEMNEVRSPSPVVRERAVDERRRERRISGLFPPHLSDPSLSPVSERMDRSVARSHRGRASSIHQNVKNTHNNVLALDSRSNANFMEIETRSRAQTPSRSTNEGQNRLKDVSNALITSKELLKIISKIWGNQDRSSSSMSLIPALHTELERARLQVNQMIHEQRSNQNEMNYIIKCLAEENAEWKSKEREVVEVAIESIAGELEVERKLRRRFESFNKKLGKELAEVKQALFKALKELESEKRAREVMEQVCDKLTLDIKEDNDDDMEQQNRESARVWQDAEEERDMFEKLRKELEGSTRTEKYKESSSSLRRVNNTVIPDYSNNNRFNSQQNQDSEDDGEIEDGVNREQEYTESDLHSIELNMDKNNSNNINYKWAHALGAVREFRKVEEDVKARRSTSGIVPRRSSSLQRSVSDVVEWGDHQRNDFGEEMERCKTVKGIKDRFLSNSNNIGQLRQRGKLWPSLDSRAQERLPTVQGSSFKSRLVDLRGDVQNARISNF